MNVFKFGGASVKDPTAIRNVATILTEENRDALIIVVSAMGKTTNALERLTDAFYNQTGQAQTILAEIRDYHFDIVNDLFPDHQHPVFTDLHNTFVELEWAIEDTPTHSYDCEYDQIVSVGELISTKIVSHFLNQAGISNVWRDARDCIQTDNTYREGKVDWKNTQELIENDFLQWLEQNPGKLIVTQGFIGVTSENFTTTLGREGSDYTAAILAYCCNAQSVTIWKDVPGVLNADPKWFDQTQLIPELSYQDAIELTYYGATVIHPKTIKPLQNKNIPLYVRSFLHSKMSGTKIYDGQQSLPIACFIFKVNQVLLSISPKDFSFILEENLSAIFALFSNEGIRVNTMQNSALSFSVCIDKNERKLTNLIDKLRENYRVLYNEDLELVTIRHYDQATIDRVTSGKEIILDVKSRYTAQMVMKNSV